MGTGKKCTISLVQMEVLQSRPSENLERGIDFISEAARRGSDLVCFPEMWTSGFAWNGLPEMALHHDEVLESLIQIARRQRIWINGTMPVMNDRSHVTNTSILLDPKGRIAGSYQKTHLFTFFHEEKFIEAGNSLCLVDTPWGCTGLSICYDIRFPELFRNYALMGAEIIISPTAFPYPRLEHWKVLTRARAIENQIYIIGTNRVGSEDVWGIGDVTYFGDSVIIGPWGETIIEGSEKDEQLLTATIDMGRVNEVRSSMNVLEDRRPDIYTNF
jgi:omega-amidase